MSQAPRDAIEAMPREVPLDAGGDLHVQRPLFEEFMRQQPLPDDLRLADGALGGVPILEIAAPEAAADARVLYFHGGVFALGSARAGGSFNDGVVWSRVRPGGTTSAPIGGLGCPWESDPAHPSAHVAQSMARWDTAPAHAGK